MPARPSNVLFLVDPAAGGGRVRRRLEAALRRGGERAGGRLARSRILELPRARVAAASAEHAEHADAVVAVGGDGTVRAVATALLEAGIDVPLGVVPLGTGNAFAHSLGMGRVEAALRAIDAGATRRIDVMLTDRPAAPVALVSISAGFEGRYLHRYARLRGWGRLTGTAYALPALLARSRGLGLTTDGRVLVDPSARVFNVGLYNMRAYAGGLVPWPHADPTDGVGDAVVLERRWDYLRALSAGAAAGLRSCWTRAELESAGPIQIDGDVHPGHRLSVRLEAGALRVLVPALLS